MYLFPHLGGMMYYKDALVTIRIKWAHVESLMATRTIKGDFCIGRISRASQICISWKERILADTL
jgi:hypothetical protein